MAERRPAARGNSRTAAAGPATLPGGSEVSDFSHKILKDVTIIILFGEIMKRGDRNHSAPPDPPAAGGPASPKRLRTSISEARAVVTDSQKLIRREFLVPKEQVATFFGRENSNIRSLQRKCNNTQISLKSSFVTCRDLTISGREKSVEDATKELADVSKTCETDIYCHLSLNQELRKELEDLQKAFNDQFSKLRDANRNTGMSKQNDLEKEISELKTKVKELSSENEKLNAENTKIPEQLRKETKRSKQLQCENKEFQEKNIQNNLKIDHLNSKISMLKQNLKTFAKQQISLKKTEKELFESQKEIKLLMKEKEEQEQNLNARQRQLSEISALNESLKIDLKNSREETEEERKLKVESILTCGEIINEQKKETLKLREALRAQPRLP